MDLMHHHSRRRSILVKVSFLVDVMCPRCNYLMASAITHICKREKERKKPPKCQSRKGAGFSLLSESNEGLLYCKGISLKRRRGHICCRCIKHRFPTCKCEFELPRTQMQKLHQWSEFDDSPVFKCVDNGHRDCTQQQSKASTIHQRTTLAAETARTERPRASTPVGSRVYGWSDGERRTGGDGCASLRFDSLHPHSSPACLSATEDAGAYAAVGNQNRLLPASSCHASARAEGRVCTVSMKHTHWNR